MSICGENSLVSGALDGKIKLWDLRQKNSAWTIKAHSGLINCVTTSPDNKIIATGSEDNYVKVIKSNVKIALGCFPIKNYKGFIRKQPIWC